MSIFDEKNKVKSDYVKFKAIGDKFEGTYIGKRQAPNNLKGGQIQNVYEFKKPNGEFTVVYGKPGIDFQMKHVKFGQIVGFEFTSVIPPKLPGHQATHVIQIYADPNMVDEKWLMEQEDEAAVAGQETVDTNYTPNTQPQQKILTTEELLKEIDTIARTKLGATTPEEVKAKVMEKTNIAFVEQNLTSILEILKMLP